MRLKTYRAKTMAEALAAVKKDLGPRAVILHTKSTKTGGWLGIGRRPVVEVIASDDARIRERGVRTRPRAAGSKSKGSVRPEVEAPVERSGAMATAVAARAYQQAAAGARAGGGGGVGVATRDEAPAAVMKVRRRRGGGSVDSGCLEGGEGGDTARRAVPPEGGASRIAVRAPFAPNSPGAQAALEQELASIKRMVGQVLRSAGGATTGGVLPEPLFKHYVRLLEAEVAREIADDVVGRVRDELTPDELTDEAIVRTTVLRHVARYIPVGGAVAKPGRAADGRPLTVALIGPTGVGKTTTVAKLAAAYKLRHGKKVGLITSDTYRIAAVDQLRTYANIIGLPLKVVLTPGEMASACASLADCDVVLIDTAGRSQNNAGRLEELKQFVEVADPHETHLVLSSTASETVLKRTADQFSQVRPNHVIFTKLDEAVNFGVLVNVIRGVSARLSYVTTGQEVPDHIESGHPDRLARLILDGARMGEDG